MQFAVWQWLVGGLAALLVGMSKTGVPGVGILTVTLLAQAYGGWNSVGLMLPMLLFGDLFAVAWYRRHAHWGVLVRLLPWVVVGLVLGAVVLHYLGQNAKTKALMNPLIGGLVLLMLGMHFLQGKLGERFAPRSKMGTAGTGVVAGLATTISNAAGPIMTIFLTAQQFAKEQFMGTIAWYFFIINASKVPIFFSQSLFTRDALLLDLLLAPAIILGAFLGRWMLPRIPEKVFNALVLILAAVGALNLFFIR